MCDVTGEDPRSLMTEFWRVHSGDATLDMMLLDTQAEELCVEEQPEILSLMPSLKGKRVLELGAGIGRFTGIFAKSAHHVTAVDFMESFVAQNRENNGHHDNVVVTQADVTKLDYPPDSFDLVFSNWLLQYLTDDEVQKLIHRTLSWLVTGGFVFFRESCYFKSGNIKKDSDPTAYRDPAFYNVNFQGAARFSKDPNNGDLIAEGLDLVVRKRVQSYIKINNHHNQICWLLQKVQRDPNANLGRETFFLDGQQYTKERILKYEQIFGEGHVSPGGPRLTKEFVAMLDLKPGQRVLDVGAGIGGGDFYMTETYGVEVVGMDLSSNMVEISSERAKERKNLKVQFELGDVKKRVYKSSLFDVIYSRDGLLHVDDKSALFSKLLVWLKPGGRLLISDYCCANLPHSDAFKGYVAQRGYNLCTPSEYGKLLEAAGFINVKVEDRTGQFIEILEAEKAKLEEDKDSFLKEQFSNEDLQCLQEGWMDKLTWSKTGDQKWCLFLAEKTSAYITTTTPTVADRV